VDATPPLCRPRRAVASTSYPMPDFTRQLRRVVVARVARR
jgi:hypothetical protein